MTHIVVRAFCGLAFATLADACASVALGPAEDPYVRLAAIRDQPLLERHLVAVLFGEAGGAAGLTAWLRDHPTAPEADRARALAALCDDQARGGRYREAAQTCGTLAALPSRRSSDAAARSAAFWRALADVPPVHAEGVVMVPLSRHWTGMGVVATTIAGVSQPWAVDTGAEVSVLPLSTAVRIGARSLQADVAVTGAIAGVRPGDLAVIDRLEIGEAVVRHLPVLVVPDETLTIAPEQTIPGLLGLPALMAFGRVTFLEAGDRLALGEAVPPLRGDSVPVHWHTAGLGIPLDGRARLSVHLDTGANTTTLSDSALRALDGHARRRAVRREARITGVSGSEDRALLELPAVRLRIGRAPFTLRNVGLVDREADADGRAGMDFVRALDSLAIDFETMRASALPRRGRQP